MILPRSLILPVLLFASAAGFAQEPTLDSLKQTYETEVQKIRDQHEVKLKGLLDAYGRSLDRAIELLRKKGDPDPVLVASAEKTRFLRDRTVPNPPADDLPRTLQTIQARYHDAVKAAEVDRGKGFVDLTKQYVQALDRLMRSLTNDNKLDLALNVKTEKERMEFVLADVESQLRALDTEAALPFVLKRGLVLHFGFDKDEGGKVSDKSGKMNHGDVWRAKWLEKARHGGGAFEFDGESGLVKVDDSRSLRFQKAVTIGLWARLLAKQPKCAFVGKWGPAGASDDEFFFGVSDGNVRFVASDGRRFDAVVFSGRNLQVGVWYHLVAVAEQSGDIGIYLNGETRVLRRYTRDGLNDSDQFLYLGSYSSSSRCVNAQLDEVMIWNRALSDTEVKQVYKLTGGQ